MKIKKKRLSHLSSRHVVFEDSFQSSEQRRHSCALVLVHLTLGVKKSYFIATEVTESKVPSPSASVSPRGISRSAPNGLKLVKLLTWNKNFATFSLGVGYGISF